MQFEITGVICDVSPIVQVTDKFRKREFVLELSSEYQDMVFTDYAKLQLLNSYCDLVNEDGHNAGELQYIIGDKVKCTFTLKGSKDKHKDVFYNNLNVFRIEGVPQEYQPVTHDQRVENFQAQSKNKNEGIPVWSADHTTNGGSGFPTGMPGPETIDDLPF